MNLNFSELAENVGFTRSHFYFRKGIEGLSWWYRGEDFRLPAQGAPVQSLIRELRSHKSKGTAQGGGKREKRKEKELMPRKPHRKQAVTLTCLGPLYDTPGCHTRKEGKKKKKKKPRKRDLERTKGEKAVRTIVQIFYYIIPCLTDSVLSQHISFY